jgi:uncharacterized protein YdeI (YjbR/CyaY-like superfamily)
MKKIGMNTSVDFYFQDTNKWHKELEQLRTIVLGCGLTEELKWGVPCYLYNKGNLVLIHRFKEYCALLFFKGALLSDANGILVQQTKNVQAARQMRFSDVKDIIKIKKIIQAYIYEAIEVEKAGLKVELKPTAAFTMPEEFKNTLAQMPALKQAFDALTPGRQRGYLLHFAAPKQSKTRESRIEKAIPQILKGKGLSD